VGVWRALRELSVSFAGADVHRSARWSRCVSPWSWRSTVATATNSRWKLHERRIGW